MNLDIFRQSYPSGKLSKVNYLIKNFTDEYNYIINYCNEKGITDIAFKEKLYLCLNQFDKAPTCKNNLCHKPVNFINTTLGYREYCSTKCISNDPKIKDLKEKKSLEKFGTKTPAESDIIKKKIIETNNKKWGSNSPLGNDDIKKKSSQTLLNNWGVKNISESSEIVKKRVDSFKKNIDKYKESFRKTNLERYGYQHPWMNSDIHKKTVESSKFHKDESFKKIILKRLENYKNYKLIDIYPDKKSVQLECPNNHQFEIFRVHLYERDMNQTEICTICNPINKAISGKETQLFNFIESNYGGEIIQNSRKILHPHEIDIFLPELNIGFEFNGLYWHSSLRRPKDYHFQKHKKAEEMGINLITIWEDDWVLKREICESFILNKLGKSEKIWARKCQIREIDYQSSKNFLNNNHFQGDCKSSVRIGLFHQNQLVCLMTFSKLRLPLGTRNKEGVWELTRFCNLNFTSVVGGASKIMKYFIEKYTPSSIETFSDNLISNGNMYEKLGFQYLHTSDPGYWYNINGKREHRFNWRKDKLIKLGGDKDKTEEEIMNEWSYYRIYNGGNKKWILNLK
jgi:hypothetical protein